jgi:Ras family protein A
LEDIDQPFVHDVQLYRRPYRFEFYDTASPESYALLQPSVVVLCFDINDRLSLFNAKDVWHKVAARNYREAIPLVLLGLKRDLRADASNMISPQEVISSRLNSTSLIDLGNRPYKSHKKSGVTATPNARPQRES